MTDKPALREPIHLLGNLHETIWGGRNLATLLGKALPEGLRIGESWETATESVARNDAYAGRTLGDLAHHFEEQLVGWRAVEVFGQRFPLLAKFIDAQQRLSVQVHPDDAYAAAHEHGKLGKTEVWYVLHADPGAQLVYGVARETNRAEVRQAIDETRLEHLLYTFEAQAGDVIFVPAGTVHAIGSGIVLYELQQYSDVTYRLYDYGRLQTNGKPRELHVEQGLDVMSYSGPPTTVRTTPLEASRSGQAGSRRVLVACRYFVMEELAHIAAASDTTTPASCQIVSVLEGNCVVRSGQRELHLQLGDTAVLPATLGAYTLYGENARIVRSYVPAEDDENLRLWNAAQRPAVSA